jgi:lactate dehydrogenase-like 2-hydroxyacid dehydrogenase
MTHTQRKSTEEIADHAEMLALRTHRLLNGSDELTDGNLAEIQGAAQKAINHAEMLRKSLRR